MRERRRGEAREKSPWTRARKLGDAEPRTAIEGRLRVRWLEGEKAVSARVIADVVWTDDGSTG